jgi:hypothetical protein
VPFLPLLRVSDFTEPTGSALRPFILGSEITSQRRYAFPMPDLGQISIVLQITDFLCIEIRTRNDFAVGHDHGRTLKIWAPVEQASSRLRINRLFHFQLPKTLSRVLNTL